MRRTVLAVTGILAACATGNGKAGSEAKRVFALNALEERPALVGCSSYTAPAPGTSAKSVTVEFVVAPSGLVDPQTVHVTHALKAAGEDAVARDPQPRDDLVAMALAAARTCTFTPGKISGTSVAARMFMTMWFNS